MMPDREKVINDLQDAVNDDWMWQHADYYALAMERAIILLKEREPKKGKWIPITNGRCGNECSLCHSYAPSYQNGKEHLSKYCPDCGADMWKDGKK